MLGDAVDLGQDALHLLETGPALGVEMLLQGADAVADGGTAGARALAAAEASAVAVALGGLVDVEEDAPDLLVIGAAAAVDVHVPAPAPKELGAEMALQHADAVGDVGRGDAELPGGADEAPVAGGGFEETQAVEGRQGYHGFGRGKRWGWK